MIAGRGKTGEPRQLATGRPDQPTGDPPPEAPAWEADMLQRLHLFSAAAGLLAALTIIAPAFAQKQGGILRMSTPDSPASMSIHEESTVFAQRPMMGVLNNLIMFDQHAAQASLQSIVPAL